MAVVVLTKPAVKKSKIIDDDSTLEVRAIKCLTNVADDGLKICN